MLISADKDLQMCDNKIWEIKNCLWDARES